MAILLCESCLNYNNSITTNNNNDNKQHFQTVPSINIIAPKNRRRKKFSVKQGSKYYRPRIVFSPPPPLIVYDLLKSSRLTLAICQWCTPEATLTFTATGPSISRLAFTLTTILRVDRKQKAITHAHAGIATGKLVGDTSMVPLPSILTSQR